LGVAADNACTPAPGPPACGQMGGGFALRLAASGGCPGGAAPNECGPALGCPCARATNSGAPQTVIWRQYAVSQRDADNDGHENSLDPCPLTANAGWNPRVVNVLTLDADGDGLPTACDPNDAAFNNDQDGDGWQNRLDNCPLVANAQPIPPPPPQPAPNVFQFDQDVAVGVPVSDGGPQADGIGPACDPAPLGANGHYHATVEAYRVCIGPATPDCAAADADGDGVANVSDNCIGGANPPPAGFSQSQRDLNANGFVDFIGDIVLLTGQFGKAGGNPAAAPGYEGRFDLNYDNFVDIFDIVLLTGIFGVTC
jgi:hypothetical protein